MIGPRLKADLIRILQAAHHELTSLHGMTAYDGSDSTKDGFIIDSGELCTHINSLLKVLDPLDRRSFLTPKVAPENDSVNHPKHYNFGKIEVIDFILDQKLSFLEGNVIKYLCRSPHKGNPKQDLEKARWYLNRLIETLS